MKSEKLFLGADLGSRASKAVLLGEDGRILSSALAPTGTDPAGIFESLRRTVLAEHGAGAPPAGEVVTGYGRGAVPGAERVTEITCHARGVARLAPGARTVVEIGGQDSKIIRLGPTGEILDFAMNDRCAAGTGRFLEMVARTLGCEVEGLDALAAGASEPVEVSSTCVVFAESEIVSLLASGVSPADVAAGVYVSIARKTAGLASRVGGAAEPVLFTGGVARSASLAGFLGRALETTVRICPQAVFTGAIGAALVALDRHSSPAPSSR